MIHSSRFIDSTQAPCRRCGTVNELESIGALFDEAERRCSHCGYRFVAHILREMRKAMELTLANPEWGQQFLNSDREWIRDQMKDLVPIEDD